MADQGPGVLLHKNIDDLLSEIGEPVNKKAKRSRIADGDPMYFITTLPFETNFPQLAEYAKEKGQIENVRNVWNEFHEAVVGMYADSQEFSSVPVWIVDEQRLTEAKAGLVNNALRKDPSLRLCSTDRFDVYPEGMNLHANRVLLLKPRGGIDLNKNPSNIAERAGHPPLAQQIDKIRERLDEEEGLLIDDIGLADGKCFRELALIIESHGVPVKKIVGGLSWFPVARDVLEGYSPESLIWFDLARGGWVESRDFLIFPNTGILIGEVDEDTGRIRLVTSMVENRHPVCFSVPDVSFGGRWFRTTDEMEISKIKSFCIDYSLKLYHAIDPGLTLHDLVQMFSGKSDCFSVPVNFGNLWTQLSAIDFGMAVNDYIIEKFRDGALQN